MMNPQEVGVKGSGPMFMEWVSLGGGCSWAGGSWSGDVHREGVMGLFVA